MAKIYIFEIFVKKVKACRYTKSIQQLKKQVPAYNFLMVTLRFCVLPAAVLLSAMGFVAP